MKYDNGSCLSSSTQGLYFAPNVVAVAPPMFVSGEINDLQLELQVKNPSTLFENEILE